MALPPRTARRIVVSQTKNSTARSSRHDRHLVPNENGRGGHDRERDAAPAGTAPDQNGEGRGDERQDREEVDLEDVEVVRNHRPPRRRQPGDAGGNEPAEQREDEERDEDDDQDAMEDGRRVDVPRDPEAPPVEGGVERRPDEVHLAVLVPEKRPLEVRGRVPLREVPVDPRPPQHLELEESDRGIGDLGALRPAGS